MMFTNLVLTVIKEVRFAEDSLGVVQKEMKNEKQ